MACSVLLHVNGRQRHSVLHCSFLVKLHAAFQIGKFKRRINEIMKTSKLVLLIVTIAATLFILIPNLSWAADDGASVYKAKCAACHGADAVGKPAAKIPSLVSDDAKKLSDQDLTKAIAETAKHPGGVKTLPADQVKAVVDYIRTLQK